MEKKKRVLGRDSQGGGLAMKNTYPPRNQFNTFMIVQTRRINAGINRLAHSFCSKPPPRINGVSHRGRRRAGERRAEGAMQGKEPMKTNLGEIEEIKPSD